MNTPKLGDGVKYRRKSGEIVEDGVVEYVIPAGVTPTSSLVRRYYGADAHPAVFLARPVDRVVLWLPRGKGRYVVVPMGRLAHRYLLPGNAARKQAMIDAELAKVHWGEWVCSMPDIGSDYYDGIEITAMRLVMGSVGGIDYERDVDDPHMISVYLHLAAGGVESAVDYPPEQQHIAEALAIGLMARYPNLRKYPPDGLGQYVSSTTQGQQQ
jgi:hypothetical protein